MWRLCGILSGLANHVLFGITVYHLYGFLAGHTGPAQPANAERVLVNFALAAQFSVGHSFLLLPSTRQRITRVIPREFYGTVFCTATCLSLLLTICFWQPTNPVLVRMDGWASVAMRMAFVGAWFLLLYSLSLTGLGYQTGLTPWLYWLRRRPLPQREFVPRGLYHLLRHPVYLAFFCLLWLTPQITLDRLLLAVTWTGYIAAGSVLKDRRLVYYLGENYRRYQAQVPGYPFVAAGPLARVPLPVQDETIATDGIADTSVSSRAA